MQGYELSASQWSRIKRFCQGALGRWGNRQRNRIPVSGVLWVQRSGAHWKGLPAEYANWTSVHKALPAGLGMGYGSGSSRSCSRTRTTYT